MKKKSIKVCDALSLVGIFSLFLSILLTANNLFASADAGRKAAVAAEGFAKVGEVSFENGNTVKNVGNHSYAGVIVIPSLDLYLPVMSDIKTGDLKTAPCRYFGDVRTENLVIAGHNYRTHFGKLKNLKPNDEVFFIDAANIKTEYFVSDKEVLPSNAVEEMKNGKYPLTLFTCTISGRERYTLRCKMK